LISRLTRGFLTEKGRAGQVSYRFIGKKRYKKGGRSFAAVVTLTHSVFRRRENYPGHKHDSRMGRFGGKTGHKLLGDIGDIVRVLVAVKRKEGLEVGAGNHVSKVGTQVRNRGTLTLQQGTNKLAGLIMIRLRPKKNRLPEEKVAEKEPTRGRTGRAAANARIREALRRLPVAEKSGTTGGKHINNMGGHVFLFRGSEIP